MTYNILSRAVTNAPLVTTMFRLNNDPNSTDDCMYLVNKVTGEFWRVTNADKSTLAEDNIAANHIAEKPFSSPELIPTIPTSGRNYWGLNMTYPIAMFWCAPGVVRYVVDKNFYSHMGEIYEKLDGDHSFKDQALVPPSGYSMRCRKDIRKEFTAVFEKTMFKHGFSRRQKWFYRLTAGKMIQVVTYRKDHAAFFIVYRNIPLCDSYEVILEDEGPKMGELFEAGENVLQWILNEDDNSKVLKDALEACETILLPFLDRVSDYKSFYDYALVRATVEQTKLNFESMYQDYQTHSPQTRGFTEVCLALGDCEEAQIQLNKIIMFQQIDVTLPRPQWTGKYYSEIIYDNLYNNLQILNAYKCGNNDFAAERIRSNEAKTMLSFKNNIVGKCPRKKPILPFDSDERG